MADNLDGKTALKRNRLDIPSLKMIKKVSKRKYSEKDVSGKIAEFTARFLGTPRFLVYLSVFCILWITWNSLSPENLRFDSASIGFTALNLMLSLQAAYTAPLILLAENRQLERDKISYEEDRQRAMRNLSDTEYLAREIDSIKMALNDIATRDFVRSELREIVQELKEENNK
jgi:uncharacterized membrane protein